MEVTTTRTTQAGDLGLEARGKKSAGCDLFLSLHSNACNSASVDAPLACCTVTGTMDVLGQQLANVVHQVMGTAQAGTIWKRQGDNGDYYGVLRGVVVSDLHHRGDRVRVPSGAPGGGKGPGGVSTV